jgi:hypothetical protein
MVGLHAFATWDMLETIAQFVCESISKIKITATSLLVQMFLKAAFCFSVLVIQYSFKKLFAC